MLSEYQLYSISIANVKKLVSNIFYKEKYMIHYENLELYLRLGFKQKETDCVLEFSQSQPLKPCI